MIALNHALTGAAIGFMVTEPLVAIPAAIVSHFICDALPHFGISENQQQWLRSRLFRGYLAVDALLCIGLVAILAAIRPEHWFIASICAFLATSPDFFWIPKFLAAKAGRREKTNVFTEFASKIQWFQKPIGAPVEIAWLAAFTALLYPFLAT